MTAKIQNLQDLSSAVTKKHEHVIVSQVNDSCLKMAVNEDDYPYAKVVYDATDGNFDIARLASETKGNELVAAITHDEIVRSQAVFESNGDVLQDGISRGMA